MNSNHVFRSNPQPPVPILTLYTKHPCPLCDELKDELQSRFAGRYRLEQVDITASGNEKFWKLYRYEIPVLFLNGEFLCKHKLNSALLETKLNCIQT